MADLGSSVASLMQIPGLQELVNQGITQQRQNMPLRTAINQQASNMLPNSAFGSGARPDMSAVPAANYRTPAPSAGTDWTKILAALMAGAGGASILSKLMGGGQGGSGGGGNLANLLKLFHRGGGSSFTNPTPGNPNIDPNNLYGPGPFSPFTGWAGNEGMDQNRWPGAGSPNVTTTEDFGLYGAGGRGDQGPYWDGGSEWGGGGSGDQGPNDGTWHP